MKYKVIPEFPHYRIWENGTIESCRKTVTKGLEPVWVKLKHTLDKGIGYYIVGLYNDSGTKNKRVHRLLAEAFIPNPDNKPHVNHKDFCKTNNNLDNLEWCTVAENTQHGLKHGSRDLSRNHNRAVFQIEPSTDVVIAEHLSLHEAERTTGVAWQNIWKVCDGRRNTAGKFHWRYK